jgi:hypothetical protein
MKRLSICAAATAAILNFSAPSFAGVVDSPVPVIDPGANSRVIYYIPGVTKNNDIETIVICTNLEKSKEVTIGLEVFDTDGSGPLNNVSSGFGDGAQALPVGATATIATGNTVGFSEDDVITGLPLNVRGGSGRIVSTSKKIACGAFLVDELFAPPTSMTKLPVINRKQQGD